MEDLGAVVENPAVVEDHPGVEDPVAQDQEQGTAANLCRFLSYILASFSLLQFDELLLLFLVLNVMYFSPIHSITMEK